PFAVRDAAGRAHAQRGNDRRQAAGVLQHRDRPPDQPCPEPPLMAVRRDRFEEAIRLVVEATGDEELRGLIGTFEDLGDTADFQANMARTALERMADAAESIAKVDAFTKLKRDLAATEAELEPAP